MSERERWKEQRYEQKERPAMRNRNTAEIMISVIDYIEEHLSENPDLERTAEAVHYSRYHLHRMFVKELGITIHDYVQRRQLTEAAKMLVFSDRPILEIALTAGYESQQAFTAAFKEMYKRTPNRYRGEEAFYPLQLRYILQENPSGPDRANKTDETAFWRGRIAPAAFGDIPLWMDLVRLVVDGFPCLDEESYLANLREYIGRGSALILKEGEIAVGVMAYRTETGSIDFLGVHPQYRKRGIARAFVEKMAEELVEEGTDLTATAFREGDKADTGCREALKRLGFAEAELLVEFGYPTQRFVFENKEQSHRNVQKAGEAGNGGGM